MTQTHATNFSNNSKNRYNKEQSTPPGFGVFFTFLLPQAVKDQVLGAFSGSHFYSFKFLKCSILEKQTFQSLFISISGSDSLVTHYLVLLSECHNLLKNPHKAKTCGHEKNHFVVPHKISQTAHKQCSTHDVDDLKYPQDVLYKGQ